MFFSLWHLACRFFPFSLYSNVLWKGGIIQITFWIRIKSLERIIVERQFFVKVLKTFYSILRLISNVESFVVERFWRTTRCIKKSETTMVSVLHSCRGSEYLYAAVFGGGRAKGTLKILQELLNHGGLVTVVRAGITYLTSKCPAGAGSSFRILFHDRTLNHASVAF